MVCKDKNTCYDGIVTKNNAIENRSQHLLHVRNVYYGSEEIHTTFDYFDEFGHLVGARPTMKPDLQESLL